MDREAKSATKSPRILELKRCFARPHAPGITKICALAIPPAPFWGRGFRAVSVGTQR